MKQVLSLQSVHPGCRRFGIFIRDLSAQPSLRNVKFAEIDLEQNGLKVTAIIKLLSLNQCKYANNGELLCMAWVSQNI